MDAAVPAADGQPKPLDAARDRLRSVSGLPLAEQVDVFDAVHRQLQDTLAGVQATAAADG